MQLKKLEMSWMEPVASFLFKTELCLFVNTVVKIQKYRK